MGEPGVGKSRLSAEFRRIVEGEGVRCLYDACMSYTTKIPYYLFRHLLMRWADIEDGDPASAVELKLKTALSHIGIDTDEWEMYLRHVIAPSADDPNGPRT